MFIFLGLEKYQRVIENLWRDKFWRKNKNSLADDGKKINYRNKLVNATLHQF